MFVKGFIILEYLNSQLKFLKSNIFLSFSIFQIKQQFTEKKTIKKKSYPDSCPEIQFFTPLYHPQVNPTTNLFNLQSEIGTWNPNSHNLIVVIKYIKNLFDNVNLDNPANPEAAEL